MHAPVNGPLMHQSAFLSVSFFSPCLPPPPAPLSLCVPPPLPLLLCDFPENRRLGRAQFRVDPESVKGDAGGITATVLPGRDGGGTSPLSLRIRFYANGVCRLKVDELPSPEGARRWEVKNIYLLRIEINGLLRKSDSVVECWLVMPVLAGLR